MPRLLFKFLGLCFLLFCCTAFGFLKANALKCRLDALQKIKSGLLTLKERLRLHSGDKNRLIGDCFGNISKYFPYLTDNDKTLWEDFLKHFGSSDTKSEYERCLAFITLFDNKITEISHDIGEKQRLYKSLGFFSGIFLCIFFV